MSDIVKINQVVKSPAVMRRFEEILGKKNQTFLAGVLSLVNQNQALQSCDPQAVLAEAMKAAVLDLPLIPALGFAFIVPYGNQPSFQIGYKGLIQLFLRTGQVVRAVDKMLSAECFTGYDEFFEPVFNPAKDNPDAPREWFMFAFQLNNGFKKVHAMNKAQCLSHGKKFSKSFSNRNSGWQTNPDAMCMKTVILGGLRKYAPLSIEIQQAINAEETISPEEINVTPESEKPSEKIKLCSEMKNVHIQKPPQEMDDLSWAN